MTVDYNSLLIALGICGACLLVTIVMSWMLARSEHFLLTWAIGVALIVAYSLVYTRYLASPNRWIGAICFAILMFALVALVHAAAQFRSVAKPLWFAFAVGSIATAVTTLPLLLGYDGLGFIALNLAAAGLLATTGWQYWRGREEAPGPIMALTILYGILSAGFLLCAGVLIVEGRMVLGAAPRNWAEDVSLGLNLAAMTGIGALSLALNHWRAAAMHRREAMTDALTGLMNRRAVFEQFESTPFGPAMAVLACDLDGFKSINDRYGHAAGDAVIKGFGAVLRKIVGEQGCAARLGGEEFAVVMAGLTPGAGQELAERIRSTFAAQIIQTDAGPLRCTVSVGLAFGQIEGAKFEDVLRAADKALYLAKQRGRNRIMAAPQRLAG